MNTYPPSSLLKHVIPVCTLLLFPVALFLVLPTSAHADEPQPTPTPHTVPAAPVPEVDFASPLLANLLQTLPALGPQAIALREADFLLGAGDRLNEAGHTDEIVGITRAFLYAGSSSIVSTLWQLDDAAATSLAAFYRYLHEDMTVAAALQAAQLEVLSDTQ